MDQAGLATLLVGREPEAIIRTLAMMSYNPAIGCVLEEGGVLRFADLMAASIPNIYTALIGRTFDTWHAEVCDKILADFKTSRGEKLSYGQAQKPLNVFLKVYVDWAKLPSRELAEKLTPVLHVPLDSVLMKFMKREFESEYESRIASVRRLKMERIVERAKEISDVSPKAIANRLMGTEFSLTAIDKEIYLQWQQFLRTLWPGKPVQLDIVGVLERRPSTEEPQVCGITHHLSV